MPAGRTYTPIARQTLNSDAASVTFSSIPSTYTDLVLVSSIKGTTNDEVILLQFNSDTATNYSHTFLYGLGTSSGSQRGTNQTAARIGVGNSNTNFDTYVAQIQNYANTTTNKTVISREASSGIVVTAIVSLWRKTPEAINTILVKRGGGNLVSGSTFTLYGIAAA